MAKRIGERGWEVEWTDAHPWIPVPPELPGPLCRDPGPLAGCLRMKGHTGRHAVYGTERVWAVWE